MSKKLKPCPFCGKKPHLLSWGIHGNAEKFGKCFQICCGSKTGCGANSAICYSENEVVKLWNRRTGNAEVSNY